MSHVAVRSDKRFRRAHVKPARPRSRWRAWSVRHLRRAVVAVALAFGVYRGAGIVAHAHVLQIDRIIVHGNDRMSSGEVLAVLSGLRGQSLLWTDLNEWRHRLLASSWVREADLHRSIPSTIDVVIVERQPSGIGRIDGQLYLVDDRGVVIDEYGPQYVDFDLPVIDGLREPSAAGTTDAARMELAARLIASLAPKPEIAKRLSQIDVRDGHNAAVILSGDPAVIQLGDQQFLTRLQSYLEVAPTLRDRIADIDYVDLRFDSRVYVRPAGKPKAAKTAGVTARPAPRKKR
jgi:cell division septal protein FtsQ